MRFITKTIEDYMYSKQLAHARHSLLASLKAKQSSTSFAVVVHLYYVENWEFFMECLGAISKTSFDLVVTIPKANQHFVSRILASFPNAHVVQVPNRGRDILSFITMADVLQAQGYTYVLKFHSKKSTHWEGGQEWLEGMMERLLPKEPATIDSILSTLEDPSTGIIGPSDVYYPLTINFPANGAHMTRIVTNLYDKSTAERVLQLHRSDYGFFGGTMFWARLDAIKDLLKYSVRNFEQEAGQVDATFAHALERLFCVVPEIEGRKNYELRLGDGVVEREYRSDNIPEWSTDHDK